MQGNGTQEHPWEITNLSDLRNLVNVAQAGEYAKLMADINCNEQCPNGWSTVILNQHLDLNNHSIIAPMLLDGNALFAANSGIATYIISNGGILNLFEEFQSKHRIFQCYYHRQSSGGAYITTDDAKLKLYNLGMSMFIRNDVDFFAYSDGNQDRGNVSVDKCTLKIKGNLNNCSNPLLNYVPLTNSKIISDYEANGNHRLATAGDSRTDIQNCRFEGKVTGVFNLNDGNTQGQEGMINNGAVINTIILTESTQSGNYHVTSHSGKSIVSSKCNSISPNSNSNVIRMNDDDIKSYAATNAAGFVTIEV